MALIAQALILPTGQPCGKYWAPFQKQFFAAIYDSTVGEHSLLRTKVQRPRYRLVYDEGRRGESKTEDCAAAALADLLTGPAHHRSYAVAGDQDQAGPDRYRVVHQEGERVVLDTLRTLQGSRNSPVQLEAAEDLVVELTRRFGVKQWIFEAPQAVASVQRLQSRLRGAEVEARHPTAETQARLFGGLYQLFANRRLVIYPHEQLRKEALSLVELFGHFDPYYTDDFQFRLQA